MTDPTKPPVYLYVPAHLAPRYIEEGWVCTGDTDDSGRVEMVLPR